MSDEHRFSLTATWDATAREGKLATADGSLACSHAGAPSLGGKGGMANPEELLIGAVSACFVQTWAIFIGKLQLPIENPVVDASCVVDKDPAGGFRVTEMELAPNVPAALWESRKAEVEKTLALAEKYCIVSKAVRTEGMAFRVIPKAV
ncbi:MAG: OsmC family protein [Thermoanaerobaculia bacterium]